MLASVAVGSAFVAGNRIALSKSEGQLPATRSGLPPRLRRGSLCEGQMPVIDASLVLATAAYPFPGGNRPNFKMIYEMTSVDCFPVLRIPKDHAFTPPDPASV